MSRLARPLAFFLSLVLALCFSHEARADAAAAEVLFKQGKQLMEQKKFSEACPKFEESQKLDPGLGTQMNLALCYTELGRTASAWSLYLEVASQAKATSQPDREKKARDAAKALEPKLANLTIEVASPPAGLEVKRNGQPVGQASWGTPLPVDPGDIQITAVAPGKKLWETRVKVEKAGSTTTVKIPELEKGEAPPQGFGAPQGSVQGYGYPAPPMPPRMKRRSGGMFGGGIAMVSVGGLGALVGGTWWGVVSAYEGEATAPAAVTILSVALVGGGIAMIVIGGKKVPADPTDASSEPKVVASPIPEVAVGLGHVQAKWQF